MKMTPLEYLDRGGNIVKTDSDGWRVDIDGVDDGTGNGHPNDFEAVTFTDMLSAIPMDLMDDCPHLPEDPIDVGHLGKRARQESTDDFETDICRTDCPPVRKRVRRTSFSDMDVC